jgi:RNA polymerase sigma-70 factor (ECF subfamily)
MVASTIPTTAHALAAAAEAAELGSREQSLVERHLWGDATAFEEVYRRYGEMVFNLAYRLAGEREEAADLTQEVFLRIYRHLGRFHGRSSLKTWIYRVALNHCRSRLGRRRPVEPLDDGAGAEPVDPSRGPESRALAGDTGRRVAAALAGLAPAFREAVVLRDLEGLAYQEIAEVLGVRVGTVRSRIARGRDQLRELLTAGEETVR